MCCGNTSDVLVLNNQSEKCLNPVAYLVKKAITITNQNGGTISDNLSDVLDNGLVSQGKDLFCCPSCNTEQGFYFLGNGDSLTELMTTIDASSLFTAPINCCVNYEAGVAVAGTIKETLDDNFLEVKCCATDLTSSILEIENKYPGIDVFAEVGVVEISNLGETTSILEILNIILEENPYADEEYIQDVFETILEKGVFVKCNDCSIMVATAALAVSTAEITF